MAHFRQLAFQCCICLVPLLLDHSAAAQDAGESESTSTAPEPGVEAPPSDPVSPDIGEPEATESESEPTSTDGVMVESIPSEENELLDMSLEALLDMQIVSVTKSSELQSEAPAVIFTITEKQFKERGYRTLRDVLQEVPGWEFEVIGGNWVEAYPRMRGVRSYRQVLMLIDGIAINDINSGDFGRYGAVPLTGVDRVEVITGPASALYGANALLGVVNVITKKPDQAKFAEMDAYYTTNAGDDPFSSHELNASLLTGHQFDSGVGYLLSFTTVQGNDEGQGYYDPDGMYKQGYQHPTYGGEMLTILDDGFNNHKSDYHLKLRLNKDHKYNVGFDYSDLNDGLGAFRHGGRVYANSDRYPSRYHYRWLSVFTDLQFDLSDSLAVVPRVYYRRDQIVNDTQEWFAIERTEDSGETFEPPVPMYTAQSSYRFGGEVQLRWTPVEQFQVLLASVGEHSTSSNDRKLYGRKPSMSDTIMFENGDDYGGESFGDQQLDHDINTLVFYNYLVSGYGQASWTPIRYLKIVGGARVDKHSGLDAEWNPKAGVVLTWPEMFLHNGKGVFKILYGQAFRPLPPYQVYDYGSQNRLEDIHPEKINTIETNIAYLLGNTGRVQLAGWFNSIHNFYLDGIDAFSSKRFDDNGIPASDFVETKTWGLQLETEWRVFAMLGLGGNYTFTDGKNEDLYYDVAGDGTYSQKFEELIRMSKHKINLFLTYHLKDYLSAYVGLRIRGKQAVPDSEVYQGNGAVYEYLDAQGNPHIHRGNGYNPAYAVLDANLDANLGALTKALTGLHLGIGLDNLLNAGYYHVTTSESGWAYPRYYPQPGRTMTLNLAYKMPYGSK